MGKWGFDLDEAFVWNKSGWRELGRSSYRLEGMISCYGRFLWNYRWLGTLSYADQMPGCYSTVYLGSLQTAH